jgi:hypothetical protein
MIDELIEAARLCEEQGFRGPASALRVAAEPNLKAFVVVERVPIQYYWREGATKRYLSDDGVPRALFHQREAASQFALVENARALRHRNLLNYMPNYGSFSGFCSTMTVPEFEARVSEILGKSFHLKLDYDDFDEVFDLPPMFPSDATDDQMKQIAALFTSAFFLVQEIEFTR